MLNLLAKTLGGLVGDTIEVIKSTGSEISDIPGALKAGFDEGLMITPEGMEQQEPCPPASEPKTVEPAQAAPVTPAAPFGQQ